MKARMLWVVVCALAACKGGAPAGGGGGGTAAGTAAPPPARAVGALPPPLPPGPTTSGGAPGNPVQFVAFDAPTQPMRPPDPRPTAPPLSLTASDGTGLALTRLDARAVVDGPLAFTELRLTFTNPQDRVIEGQFAITLPEGAAVSRFAMQIDGAWMEAEMVERQAARRAYEDFLHRRQDPALLEKAAGNEFSARVFPIPARGDKQLVIAYSEALPDPDAPFVLPLRGLPRIGDVSARVQVARVDGGALYWDVATMAEHDWQPDHDLAVAGSGASHALGAPGVVALRVSPELAAAPEAFDRATVLVDTSASRALGFPGYAHDVEQLVLALAAAQPGLEVTVAAFDQDVSSIYAGPAASAADAIESALIGRGALGASRLDAALAWAQAQGAAGRLIVVTDGVVTSGALDAEQVAAAAKALAPAVERVDVVLAGGIRDRAVADALSRGVAARDGTVLDLDAGAAEVARRLGLATRSGLAVAVEGASWTWPTVLDGVQPGDAAMIYAGFDGGATPAKVAVTIGTDRRELAVEPAAAPLVHRAVVAAEIALYEAGLGAIEDPAARAAAVDQIVDLSTRYRVLSDHTALLVLETEADYQRFGIDRNALSGILVAGDRGVEIMSRDVPVFLGGAAPPSRDAPDKPELALEQNRLAQELDSRGDDGEPPPEEPAVADDDGSEESGGTGTAMALDEGRMGKKESDRAEGQYKMKKRDDDVATGSSGPAGAPSIDQPRSAPVADPYMEPPPPPPPPPRHEIQQPPPVDDVRTDKEGRPVPYAGRMAKVMDLLAAHKLDAALAEARRWRAEAPGDVLALIALGEAYEARGDAAQAARVYGSIIDLFPARADLRRFAGERLDRLAGVDGAAGDGARALAVDTYQRAVAQRPDHLTGHRLLAYALVRAGRLADAFAAIETGLAQTYPPDRFAEGDRILREDLGLIGAAWLRADAKAKPEIERRLAAASATLATGRSLRFVLVWETDANDVDFHIHDARGGHAFYSQRELASGGELYADVTTGYGPECFTIPGTPKAAPYRLSIHYYSRGPMGYGMGKLQVLRHDGKGTLTFEDRPFVVMNDQAFVELGSVK